MLTELATAWSTARITGVQQVTPTFQVALLQPSIGGGLRVVLNRDSCVLSLTGPGAPHVALEPCAASSLHVQEQVRRMMMDAFGPEAQLRWALVQAIAVLRAQKAGWFGEDLIWILPNRPKGTVFLTPDSERLRNLRLSVCRRGDSLFQSLRVPFGRLDQPRLGPTYMGLTVPQDTQHARMARLHLIRTASAQLGIDPQPYIEAPGPR